MVVSVKEERFSRGDSKGSAIAGMAGVFFENSFREEDKGFKTMMLFLF